MIINQRLHKILHFSLTKIVIGLVVLLGVVIFSQWFIQLLLNYLNLTNEAKGLIKGIITAIVAILSYRLLFKYYEKRTITELSTTRIARNLTLGILLGAILQSLTIWVIYINGGYNIITYNPISYLIRPLTMAFSSAIFEELLVRGIIFRILEEKLGSYIALFISAAIFGGLHLANPNSSITAAIGLALQAGLFLGVAFMYTRNLWFPIAIHFAWNFTQAGIFGATISGNSISKSLITSHIEGNDWYTGGAFGPEGSIQATLFCLLATLGLLILSHKQQKVILPYWRQPKS